MYEMKKLRREIICMNEMMTINLERDEQKEERHSPEEGECLFIIEGDACCYITPSSRNFSCHFHAEARTSSSLASAFQPNTWLA